MNGGCNGGAFCNPTVPMFNSHTAAGDANGQNQGRIMVDGMSINAIAGQANGVVLNSANASEVAFTLSGSLGESQIGGVVVYDASSLRLHAAHVRNGIVRIGGRQQLQAGRRRTALDVFDRRRHRLVRQRAAVPEQQARCRRGTRCGSRR